MVNQYNIGELFKLNSIRVLLNAMVTYIAIILISITCTFHMYEYIVLNKKYSLFFQVCVLFFFKRENCVSSLFKLQAYMCYAQWKHLNFNLLSI